jgi:hypothetical protein
MAIKPPEYQLKMALNVPDADQAQDVLSLEEVRLRSEAARAGLENGTSWPVDPETKLPKPPAMMQEYYRLCAGGWPWRVAMYIVWLATPKRLRWPASQEELATQILGLTSDRVLSTWRTKNPVIDALARDIGVGRALERLTDSIDAMMEVAAIPDYKGKGDRELHLKMAGVLADGQLEVVKRDGLPDLSKLSWEEKLALAGLDTPEKIEAYKKELGFRNGDVA